MKNKLLLFFFMVFMKTIGQNIKVSGVVMDEKGNPLEFVTVKGGQNHATTDGLGTFLISVPEKTSLKISLVGYQSKSVLAEKNLKIVLQTQENNLDEIVVVGSRNPKKSKMETAVAVDVVPLAKIKNTMPQTTLNDMLGYVVPSFNSNRQSSADGTELVDPASLRGLGPDQVLVLVNGKRRHTSSLVNYQNTVGNGSVGTDLSAIPSSAIKRIEVLRDGASAQYGSDAIAGVINLVLKDNVGLEANATYGQTSRNDGQTTNFNLNYGTKLGDNGGFLNVSAEFNNREKTNRSQNHNLIIFDQSAYGNFNAYDFSKENARSIDDAILAEKGLSRDDFNFQIGDAKVQNIQGFFNLQAPVNSTIDVYASGGFNTKKGVGFGFRRLPSETDHVVSELFPLGFQPELLGNVSDVSLIAGAKFKLGTWKMDLSNTFGQNDFSYGVDKTNNFSMGVNSPTRFDAGSHHFMQNTVNLDLNRSFDKVLSGLNFAAGLEYRTERYWIKAGEEASYLNGGAQSFVGFSPLNEVNESRSNVAAYTDFELNVSKNFLVDLALRYEDFTDFGKTFNGKVSTRYKIADNFSLRAAASNGFRAPSLHQQYFNNIATDAVDGKILNSGIFRNDSQIAQQLGIPDLKQETSNNYSAGFTFSPIKKFNITVDGYYIRIKDRIILTGNLGNDPYGDAVPEIRAMLEPYGAQTARFFTNAINTTTRGMDLVMDYDLNLGASKFNFSLLYNLNVNKVDDKLNAVPSIFVGQEDIYYGPQERSLIETNTPKHKATLGINFSNKKWNAFVRNTYFGEVTRDGFPFGTTQVHAGKLVTDATVSYQISPKVQFTVGANNLFDVFPDEQIYENSYFGVFKYAPVQMGTTGAYYFARLSYKL